jgi:hypothetical protein
MLGYELRGRIACAALREPRDNRSGHSDEQRDAHCLIHRYLMCSSTIFGWFEKFPTCALIYKSVSLPKQHSLAKGDVRFWPLAGIAQMSLSRVKRTWRLHCEMPLLTQSGHRSRAAERLAQKYIPPAFWSAGLHVNAAGQMHSLHDAFGLQLSTRLSFCPCLFPLWSKSGSGIRHTCGP